MRTLSLGIIAEGSTDIDFLTPLLGRLARDLLIAKSRHVAHIPDPVALPGRPMRDTFRETLQRFGYGLSVIIVHTDGNGDWRQARRERIDPVFQSVEHASDHDRPALVPAIPVREIEAWMLSDTDALNRVFGTRKPREALGLPPRQREVEQITDPKMALKDAQFRAVGRRTARRVGTRPLYARLGQEVSLTDLSHIAAFGRFAHEFESSLEKLGFLAQTRAHRGDH